MLNKYTGEVPLDIHGIKYKLVYDWQALAVLKSNFTDEQIDEIIQGKKVEGLDKVLECGLMKHHSDIDADEILRLSPALVPTLQSLSEAIAYSYFGYEDAEKKSQKKTPILTRMLVKLSKLLILLFILDLTLMCFGIVRLGNLAALLNLI